MFSNNHQRRTHESPMDFEWHGQSHGPTDPNSPFPKLQPGQKGGFNLPTTTSSFLASASKPAPQFRNPSFTTPRKGNFDPDLFSEASGIDSSPGDIADAEDTPDIVKNTKTMAIFSNAHPEKQPIFGRYGAGFTGNSPGRADMRRGKYANAVIANKARKRKRIERDYTLAKGFQSDSESEDDSDRSKGKSKQQAGPHWLGAILSGIESRPNLPSVISYWLQLSLNFFLLLLALYAMVSFWLTIRSDVDKASEVARSSVIAEITQCQRDYLTYNCANNPPSKVAEMCQVWGDCMERDPELVQRARISAHTFAEILNDFIEPISWKAMIFMSLILTMCILVNNLAFGMFRSKAVHPAPVNPFFHPPPQNYQWGAPPQTPQHNSGYDIYGNQGYQQIMPSHTPGQRSPSKEMRSPSKGSRSPSKGDRY